MSARRLGEGRCTSSIHREHLVLVSLAGPGVCQTLATQVGTSMLTDCAL